MRIPISLTIAAALILVAGCSTEEPMPADGELTEVEAFDQTEVEAFDQNPPTFIPENGVEERESLRGYLQADVEPGDLNYGVSFYTGIWSTFGNFLPQFFQRGHGTWLTPDNSDTKNPLCRPGTYARENWPERAPSYADVFQTIEGGPGYWANTAFPDAQMKYRVNIVTDCYTTLTSSPGWNWGGTSTLGDQAGLAQISNTLLYAPDGITFRKGTNGSFLGQAWMNLPLTSGIEESTLVGKNNWTLFLNAGNFSGPTVYVVPEAWFRITEGYEPAEKRGLDSRRFLPIRGLADEIGSIGSVAVTSGDSKFFRIPKMNYPVDDLGRTIYHQDLKTYSKESMHGKVEKFIRLGLELSSTKLDEDFSFQQIDFTSAGFGWTLAGKEISDLDKVLSVNVFEGGKAWGIEWKNQTDVGVFPQYFIENEDVIKPIEGPYSDAFIEAGLLEVVLPKSPPSDYQYEPPIEGWPSPEDERIYQADLIDGSSIDYGWYKFIDQPSIKKLDLSEKKREQLQSVVEEIHRTNWGNKNPVLQPPTTGELAFIDDALVLAPPQGMEIGYVPIALRQYATPGLLAVR
jgi:hypothetical protein